MEAPTSMVNEAYIAAVDMVVDDSLLQARSSSSNKRSSSFTVESDIIQQSAQQIEEATKELSQMKVKHNLLLAGMILNLI